MTVDDMRAHIDRLIAGLRATRFPLEDDFHVYWIENAKDAFAITDDEVPVELRLPKVRSIDDYVTCLHELGHVSGRYQRGHPEITRERWAWQYAREQALEWTEEMESIAREALRTVLAKAGVRG